MRVGGRVNQNAVVLNCAYNNTFAPFIINICAFFVVMDFNLNNKTAL